MSTSFQYVYVLYFTHFISDGNAVENISISPPTSESDSLPLEMKEFHDKCRSKLGEDCENEVKIMFPIIERALINHNPLKMFLKEETSFNYVRGRIRRFILSGRQIVIGITSENNSTGIPWLYVYFGASN